MEDTLALLDMAAQLTCESWNSYPGDLDFREYIVDLRDEVIIQYSTILISVSESDDAGIKASYEQHLPVICEFIKKTLQNSKGDLEARRV